MRRIARRQVIRKRPSSQDYATLAGRSDAVIEEKTGRNWAAWVALLDREKAIDMPHRRIADLVSAKGTPDWWSQTVAVGYERIRGLREIGQRLDGAYETSKSRTFAVSVTKLFDAFAKPRVRARWLPNTELRSATPRKRVRLRLSDGTSAEVGFIPKTAAKSAVAIQHQRLPDKATATRMKTWWSERLDALAELLGV